MVSSPQGVFAFQGTLMKKTAILVDGGFFVRRFRSVYPAVDSHDPCLVADQMTRMCHGHLYPPRRPARAGQQPAAPQRPTADLYRIYFYDCPPLEKRLHTPLGRKAINLGTQPEALFRKALHAELRKQRKTALRLGRLDEKNGGWTLRPRVLDELIKGKRVWADLTDKDFYYYARQKIVDMKIGLDIAVLAEKRLVDQIVLIAGDSDFVPAAKHARREGIDFLLDPMWNPIAPDLHEHIDGLRSTSPNPARRALFRAAGPEEVPEEDLAEDALDPGPVADATDGDLSPDEL